MEPPDTPPLPSPTRRASPHIKVWVLPSEKAAIQAKAAAHTLSDSAYLRALGLDMPLRSTLDQEAILELAKINGDLGRLGGLLEDVADQPRPGGQRRPDHRAGRRPGSHAGAPFREGPRAWLK